MKAYTDINQSKKLAEILPPDSCDMWWREVSYGFYHIEAEIPNGWYNEPPKGIPCWSLAALLDILPETIEDKWGEYDLNIDMIYKKPEYIRVCDCHHCDFPSWDWDNKELLDNIVEAVIWLNNNGYLRDEKLY